MIVHYTTLPTEDWTIAFYTPKNHYYMVTRHLNQIALLMVIALVSGLLMIQFLVNRQYNPVKQIIKGIPATQWAYFVGLLLASCAILCSKMPWARGDLQIFPKQTIKIFIVSF